MELRYQSRWVKFFVSLIIVCFNIIWLITEIRTLGLAVNLASGGAIATEIGSAIAFAIIICMLPPAAFTPCPWWTASLPA